VAPEFATAGVRDLSGQVLLKEIQRTVGLRLGVGLAANPRKGMVGAGIFVNRDFKFTGIRAYQGAMQHLEKIRSPKDEARRRDRPGSESGPFTNELRCGSYAPKAGLERK